MPHDFMRPKPVNERLYAPCRRGCCWTPFGTCAQQRQCNCHQLKSLDDLLTTEDDT